MRYREKLAMRIAVRLPRDWLIKNQANDGEHATLLYRIVYKVLHYMQQEKRK